MIDVNDDFSPTSIILLDLICGRSKSVRAGLASINPGYPEAADDFMRPELEANLARADLGSEGIDLVEIAGLVSLEVAGDDQEEGHRTQDFSRSVEGG